MKRGVVIAGATAAAAVVAGSMMGLADFLAPEAVRAAHGGHCVLFCVPTAWVFAAAVAGGAVGGVVSWRVTRPRSRGGAPAPTTRQAP